MSELMPAAFLGHGSPMNTLDHNGYTEAWMAFGESVPDLAQSSLSPHIGTSTPLRSPPWLNQRRSTTSTVSPMNSSTCSIALRATPPWQRS